MLETADQSQEGLVHRWGEYSTDVLGWQEERRRRGPIIKVSIESGRETFPLRGRPLAGRYAESRAERKWNRIYLYIEANIDEWALDEENPPESTLAAFRQPPAHSPVDQSRSQEATNTWRPPA